MHVALVTTSYPDAVRGSEAAGGFVAEFARELSRHVRVTVVAAAGAASETDEEGVRVCRFAVDRMPLSLLQPLRPTDWPVIVRVLRDGQRTLDDIARADRPDYVLALWALPSGHWARSTMHKFDIPFAVWALGSDIWSLGRIPVLRSYLGRVLGSADRRYADGLQLGRNVEALCGQSCEFLPSTRTLQVDELSDAADTAPYRLAFLGRWHHNKGVDMLLDALRQLSDDDWARISELRICGGGPLEDMVRTRVAELEDSGRPVSLGGYLDQDQAAELIAWADYMVLPSRIESIPVIFSDSAQLRRPLIATPVGDLPSLFERSEFGILAAAATSDALADALRRALADSASRFRPALEEVMLQFDITAIVRRFVSDIESGAT